MQQSTALHADRIVQQLRDTRAEDELLDTAIDMMATVADFLMDERRIGLANS